VEFRWIESRQGRNGGRRELDGFQAHVTHNKDDSITISLSEKIMQAMRWVIGDRVAVGHDNRATVLLIRRNASGYKLCKPGGAGKNIVAGKCIRSITRLTDAELLRLFEAGKRVAYEWEVLETDNTLKLFTPKKA
jgi:hypothetical protein